MQLKQKVTDIFIQNISSDKRIVINRGGTRSSKTHSLLQAHIEDSFMHEKLDILVTRKELPALKLSALKDFLEILSETPVGKGYLEDKFKSHLSSPIFYENKQTKSRIYFIGSKEQQKVRGVKWGKVHMNEGNEIDYEVLRQFLFRTEAQIFIDFNPSDEQTWINQELELKRMPREGDVEVIKSSYLDNPFLPSQLVKEIEMLRDTDENYWHIFGLGEYGNITHKIYRNKKKISRKDFDSIPSYHQFYGVDWGDVHPMAAMHYKYYNEKIYGRQVYYKKGKEDDLSDIASDLKQTGLRSSDPVYCDTARPSNIRSLRKMGIKAVGANKEVIDGISFVNRMPIFISDDSADYWRENNKYKRLEDPNGNPAEHPVKFDDDLMDAERYAVYSHLNKNRRHIK